MHITREWFQDSIISQDDDEDYSESGYVAGLLDHNTAYLTGYSHCSCNGTFTSIGSYDPLWHGPVDDLVEMATRIADPVMPERDANKEDHDYDHLIKVYEGIVRWNKSGRPYNSVHLAIHTIIKESIDKYSKEYGTIPLISYTITNTHLSIYIDYNEHIMHFSRLTSDSFYEFLALNIL